MIVNLQLLPVLVVMGLYFNHDKPPKTSNGHAYPFLPVNHLVHQFYYILLSL
jgi:hypothetical protein